jgi:hypothetical protein
MKAAEGTYPPGTIVMVDARDSVGAYVFRNGLHDAAELYGLRRDLSWERGTGADLRLGELEELGSRVHLLGIETTGAIRDWTTCERSLYDELPERSHAFRVDGTGVFAGTGPQTDPPGSALFLKLARDSAGTSRGLVLWRARGEALSMRRSRTFSTDVKPLTYVRIDLKVGSETELRVIHQQGAMGVKVVELVEGGAACRLE